MYYQYVIKASGTVYLVTQHNIPEDMSSSRRHICLHFHEIYNNISNLFLPW